LPPITIGGPPGRAGQGQQLCVAQAVEVALERDRVVAPEEAGDDLQPFLEAGEAAVGGEQVEAERGVLPLLPARAEPEAQPTAREVVDGGGGPGGGDRVAERDRRDERPELDPRGVRGEPGERRPEVEGGERRAVLVDEVVGAEEAGEAVLLGGAAQRLPARPVQSVLALDHQRHVHVLPPPTPTLPDLASDSAMLDPAGQPILPDGG
jgi:hypothetical protein